MENKTLAAFTSSIHQLFARTTPNQTNKTVHYGPTSSFQTEFYSQTATLISNVKLEIKEALQRMGSTDSKQALSSIQLNMLKAIKVKLAMLNRDNNYLFEEGILTIYEDWCGLQKTCDGCQVRQGICHFVNETLQCLKDLFLHYFLYQEYLHRKEKRKLELVDKNDQGVAEDGQLIEEIKKEWESLSIQELLQREVKKHEDKIKEAMQVCRICFSNILIRHIQGHVMVCQKHNSLQQLKRQCISQLVEAKAELKKKYQQAQLNNSNTDHEVEFINIARIILNHQQKIKEVDRRCSLVERGKIRQVEDIRKFIDDFIDQNGDHSLLAKVSQLYKQKAYLQKQIAYIETQSHKQSQKKLIDKSSFSIKSKLSSAQRQGPLLKKQSSLVQDNKSSFAKSESQSQKQFEEFKQKSKRCLSRNALKRNEQEPLCPINKYSSLQQIMIGGSDVIKKNVRLQNFQLLKVLGEGAFGKVYMVRRKETRDIYALKIIKMPQNNIQNSLQSIKRQHSIFKKIGGEHLVKAPFSFSQKSCHFFILQYLPGGDLRKLLDEQVYLQQDRARAYLAEIILAIEHLHHFDVIHRDLKPQNLVFDKTGHLKLTDFGLSQFQMKQRLQKSHKQQKERSKKTRKRREAVLSSNKQKMKLIGTPDYIAPEIIFKISSNNFSIDWWSLGVMAYELMIGARPFCAQSIQEVIDNITKFTIQWPQVGYEQGMISPQAKDLICQLLNKDFMHRLGANGAEQIKKHPFFAKICWQTIKSDKPLAMPKITNVRNYDRMEEDVHLRKEIRSMIEGGEGKRKVQLQQFVRFDLLGKQTLESSLVAGQKQRKKLKTLKFLQCNVGKGEGAHNQA